MGIRKMSLRMFVTVLGLGLLPKAPGTMGTLGACVFALLFLYWAWWWQIATIVGLAILGIWACQLYEQEFAVHDSGEMVIDEFVGYLVTVFYLPPSLATLIIGFVVFRVLDIFKPLGIGLADRKISGGLGVMADDLLAGIIGGMGLQWLHLEYPQILQWGLRFSFF